MDTYEHVAAAADDEAESAAAARGATGATAPRPSQRAASEQAVAAIAATRRERQGRARPSRGAVSIISTVMNSNSAKKWVEKEFRHVCFENHVPRPSRGPSTPASSTLRSGSSIDVCKNTGAPRGRGNHPGTPPELAERTKSDRSFFKSGLSNFHQIIEP